MGLLKCLISNPVSKSYAAKHKISERIVLQKMDSWQIANNTNELPTEEQLEEYMGGNPASTLPMAVIFQLGQAVNEGQNIAKVNVDNKDYLVTKNGTVISMADFKVMQFFEDDPVYQEIIGETGDFLYLSDEDSAINEEEERYSDSSIHVTAAPYFNTPLTKENAKEIRQRVEKDFLSKAEKFAKELGISIKGHSVNIGGFTFSEGETAGQHVDELSYSFELDTSDKDKADLFASLMGDLGHEQQEAVISSNYSDKEHSNALQFAISVKSTKGLVEKLQQAGITGYTVDTTNNKVYLLAFDKEGEEEIGNKIDKLKELIGENNYEGVRKEYIQSRYLDRQSRQNAYEKVSRDDNWKQDNRQLYLHTWEAYHRLTGRDLETGEPVRDSTGESEGITPTLTITPNEYTDEFRRVQKASLGLSEEKVQQYHSNRSGKELDDNARLRLGKLYGRLFSSRNGARQSFRFNLKAPEKKGSHVFSFAQVNGSLFHDIFQVNRQYLENGELVDLHDSYDNAKCFLSSDGLCGFAIENDGNLVSVFSLNPSTADGFLYAIKDFVKEQGATHLDAYMSKNQPLEKIYQKTLGFQTAATMDYNMEYDHDDIAENHGNPNVAFMVLSDKKVENKHFNKNQYDDAVSYQKSQINAESYNKETKNKRVTYSQALEEAVSTGKWSPETLKELDNLAEQLENGTVYYKRFPQKASGGLLKGGRINEEASIILRGSGSTSEGATLSVSQRQERDKRQQPVQEQIVENWAKAKGVWFDDQSAAVNGKKQIAEGGKATVFYDGKGIVTKIITADYFMTPQFALDRITLHNTLFPEAALTLKGFGRNSDGKFVFIAEQPFIEGKHATKKEIQDFMEKSGFKKLDKDGGNTYVNESVYLFDLHDENIIKTPEGNIVVIDADVRLNTPELDREGSYKADNSLAYTGGKEDKKEDNKSQEEEWQIASPEYQKKADAAKTRLRDFHLATQQGSSSSVWRMVAKGYGYDNGMGSPKIDDWYNLSVGERKALLSHYEAALSSKGGLARPAPVVNLAEIPREDVKNSPAAKRKIRMLLGYNQVKNSDGVYVIGHISDPGETTQVGNSQYTNNASFQTVDGTDGILVRYAQTTKNKSRKPIPVHVFDELRGGWYRWNGRKFVEEETPELTPDALLLGMLGNKDKNPFKAIGKANVQAIRNVFEKTFGFKTGNYIDRTARLLNVNELGKLRQLINAKAADFETDNSIVNTPETPEARLNREIPPVQRGYRTSMMAHDFSGYLEAKTENAKDEDAENEYNQIKENYKDVKSQNKITDKDDAETVRTKRKAVGAAIKALVAAKKYMEDVQSDNPVVARKAVLQHYGLDYFFSQMKKDYQVFADEAEAKLNFSEASKWKAVSNNFDLLMQEAFEEMQAWEGFRIIPFKNRRNRTEGAVSDDQQQQLKNEEDNGDDEYGTNSAGNDGWSFKVRLADPAATASLVVKNWLSSILLKDSSDNYITDDLKMVRYLNPEYAHAVLLDKLSGMIDADSFSVPIGWDDNGNPEEWRYPVLEKLVPQYPWVSDIIEVLSWDNTAASAFFHDFNQSFIPYEIIDENGKTMTVNQESAAESGMSTVLRNYENDVRLTPYTVYKAGKVVKENGRFIGMLTQAAKYSRIGDITGNYNPHISIRGLRKVGFSEEEVLKYNKEYTLADVFVLGLQSLGFEVDSDYIHNFIFDFIKQHDAESILSAVQDIASNIGRDLSEAKTAHQRSLLIKYGDRKQNENQEDDDYYMFFRHSLRRIAEDLGDITEGNHVMSFREGKETRFSYSAPNAVINRIKKIKDDRRRDKFLEEEYGSDPWFKKDGKWRTPWIAWLQEVPQVRENLQYSEILSMKINRQGEKSKADYSEWDWDQTNRVMLAKYFEKKAWTGASVNYASYIMPIFSDSPVCASIRMPRFVTGMGYADPAYSGDNDGREKTFKEKLMPYLIGVVRQETDRISLVRERKRSNAPEIQNFDKTGGKYAFFPELNNLKLVDGRTFADAVRTAIENKDMDEFNRIAEAGLTMIMDINFDSYINSIDLTSVKRQLQTLKAVHESNKKDADGYRYSEEEIDNEVKDALEEFFWNHTFATTQMIELSTTDLAYYKNAVDFQKRFKQEYASGQRFNTKSRYGRKFERTIYLKDKIVTASRYSGLKKSLERAVTEGRMTKGQMTVILEGAKHINVADAQAYISPWAFRASLDMMGKWTEEMDESFNNIMNNKWDARDFAIMWQPLKPFIFSTENTDNGITDPKNPLYGQKMRVPHQNKNSEFLVLAFLDMIANDSKDSEFLVGLGRFFEQNKDIDVIQFESAVKAGGHGTVNLNYDQTTLDEKIKKLKNPKVTDFNSFKEYYDNLLDKDKISQEDYNDIFESLEPTADEIVEKLNHEIAPKDSNGNAITSATNIKEGKFDNNVVHTLNYADKMIAQPTPEHIMDVEDATSGSQFRNLILANLSEGFTAKIGNRTYTKQQILDMYDGATVNNLLDSFDELKEMFGDIHTLQKYLFETIKGNPKFGSDIIEALQIITVPDPRNPSEMIETFNLPTDVPSTKNQIQELITSVFRNRITKQKINGGNCIQVAGVGFSKKLNIERDEEGNITAVKCLLPAWSQKFFAPFITYDKMEAGTEAETRDYGYIDIKKMEKECPDMLRLVGYRIPTENKYSMLPLKVVGFTPQQNGSSIILPADITYIAGSDFDVDKMFLRIPAIDKEYYKETGKIRKLHYDLSGIDALSNVGRTWDITSQGRMTKQQRDNLMIDIETAVLTSKEGSTQLYTPGNFDELKRNKAKIEILDDYLIAFIVENIKDDGTPHREVIDNAIGLSENPDYVNNLFNAKKDDGTYLYSLEDLNAFLDGQREAVNSLFPQAFLHFHEQNMAGKGLVGVYANGSSVHAKMQRSKLRLVDSAAVRINGRLLSDLHHINRVEYANGLLKNAGYIQDTIAQFQGASVDNAKEQVLSSLYQSMKTSGNTLFMARLGMSVDEIAMMFSLVKNGLPSVRSITDTWNTLMRVKGFGKPLRISENIDITDKNFMMALRFMWYSKELLDNMAVTNPKEKAAAIGNIITYMDKMSLTMDELYPAMQSMLKSAALYERIDGLKKELKPANDVMRADSPNNALAPSFPEGLLQKRAVENVRTLFSRKGSSFRGETNLATETYKEFIANGLLDVENDSRNEMLEKLMSARHPVTQAFYSLGIESASGIMSKFFIEGNSDMQELLEYTMNQMPDGIMSPKQINSFFREYIQYVLSKTKTFGDDGNRTFDEKREYYLYHFPKLSNFRKAVSSKPELRDNFTVRRIISKGEVYPSLALSRSGRLTPLMKSQIRRDLNALLRSEPDKTPGGFAESADPEVTKFGIDLFMYSYYHDGFNYKAESFGAYFDSFFWSAFPEVVNYLRTFRYRSDFKQTLNNFYEMWLANHAQEGMFKTVKPSNINENGEICVQMDQCKTLYSNGEPAKYVHAVKKGGASGELALYRYTGAKEGKAVYRPVPVFDEENPVYNANSNAYDMEKVYYNNRLALLEAKKNKDGNKKVKITNTVKEGTDENDNADSPSVEVLAANNGNNSTENAVEGALKTQTEIADREDMPNPDEMLEQDEKFADRAVHIAGDPYYDNSYDRDMTYIESTIAERNGKSPYDNMDIQQIEKESEDRLRDENPCGM